jgi:hypothetical protein
MQPNDSANSPQTKIRLRWQHLAAISVLAFFSMATAAQALYVRFDAAPDVTAPVVDVQVDGLSLSIISGTTQVRIRNAEKGLNLSFALDYKTIRFNGGPVQLNRIDWNNPAGKLFARSASGPARIDQDSPFRRLVSSVTSVGPRRALGARGFEVTRVSNPIPEPGAALLFSAGLLAVGVHSRRQR